MIQASFLDQNLQWILQIHSLCCWSVMLWQRMPLKAVTLTHVRYEAGDSLGLVLAWASLLPVFISLGGFITHFIFRRELQGMFFALGLLIAQFFSESVKKAVKESRPFTCEALEMCDSHGWPSSHSVYMSFFSIYITLLAACRLSFSTRLGKVFTMAVPWPFAFLVMYSRIYLGYHTPAQVVGGACFGLILGTVWFLIVNVVLVHTFPVLEELPICKFLCIRDSTHIQNVILFEYQNCRAARKMAENKVVSKPSNDWLDLVLHHLFWSPWSLCLLLRLQCDFL